MNTMAKKRPAPSGGDRHQQRWVVNLPMLYKQLFQLLKVKNRRSMTEEVAIALEAHLAEAGLWPPPSDLESEA